MCLVHSWYLIKDLSGPVCYHYPLSHYAFTTVAFLLFLKHNKFCPASGPLHLLYLLLELHSFSRFSLVSASSSLCSNVSVQMYFLRETIAVYSSYSHFLSFIPTITICNYYLVYSLLLPYTPTPKENVRSMNTGT